MFLRIPFGPSQEDTIYANQLQIIWAIRKQKLPLIFFFPNQEYYLRKVHFSDLLLLRDVYDVTCSDYNHFQAEFILLRISTPDDINPFWYFLICSIQSGGAHVAGNELKFPTHGRHSQRGYAMTLTSHALPSQGDIVGAQYTSAERMNSRLCHKHCC